jgi:hypothetical protein
VIFLNGGKILALSINYEKSDIFIKKNQVKIYNNKAKPTQTAHPHTHNQAK